MSMWMQYFKQPNVILLKGEIALGKTMSDYKFKSIESLGSPLISTPQIQD